jgi:hypothetical protein
MKTNKILAFFTVIAMSVALVSCVQDDDFSIPNSLGNEENAGLQAILAGLADGTLEEVSIAEVKNQFVSGEATEIVSDIVVKGYVTSSDASGNFYKEFYIQDAPENPTSAIKVILNQVDSYNQFNVGREVYISLKGLYVGEARTNDDVIAIGGVANVDGEVEAMTANQIPLHLFRSGTTETMVPLELTFAEISESHIGMLVIVQNVQFPEELIGQSFVDALDDFDTQRTMQSCDGFGYSNFILETSSFANFKQVSLPSGGGTITGLITKTFNGSDLVMALNSLDDVALNNERCSPLDINDFNVVFEDGFDTGISNWTTYNVLGAQVWGDTSFGNPGPSAYMNGFSSGAQNNEDWLISSAIDLSGISNTIFFFETDKRYDGNDLEVFISTDYSGGDPNSNGTWTQVEAIMDANAGSWNTWTNSGNIDVSSADGQMLYIAFKYTSSTSAAATFELDNVTVLGL